MKNKLMLGLLMGVFSSTLMAAEPFRILFGSCGHQSKPMPILQAINAEQPDVFVFLGDNIYGDTEDMNEMAAKYKQLGNKPGIQTLLEQSRVLAIWDDHDFGENDAGAEYPQKEASRQLMLDFFAEPNQSERRQRSDGIYTSYYLQHQHKVIQIILPDLRWNRTPLESVNKVEYFTQRQPKNLGPYSPHADEKASMLGEKQWQWLESELKKPADIRIIGSSLQLLAEFTGWESWANFPKERQRLLDFIQQEHVNGVVMISGDTHWGEISRVDLDYPIWEVTSSGLTEEWKHVSPNRHRVGDFTNEVNYGFLTISDDADPVLEFGLKDVNGDVVAQTRLTLSSLGSQ